MGHNVSVSGNLSMGGTRIIQSAGGDLIIRGGTSGGLAINFNGSDYNFNGLSGGTAGYVCVGSGNKISRGATCATSSSLYKNNVATMADALNIIGNLRPVSFDWKTEYGYRAADGGVNDFGFIAQEVVNVVPEMVTYNTDGSIQGVRYDGFVPFLVRGIQQQQSQINALQQSVGLVNGGTINGNIQINGNLSVSGSVTVSTLESTADITVGGHIITKGRAPVATTGVAAGQSMGGANVPAVVVDGTDSAGTVTLTTGGQNTANGVLAHIDFDVDFGTSYKVVISAGNDNGAGIRTYVVKTAQGFDIVTKDALVANNEYTFDYIVLGANQQP